MTESVRAAFAEFPWLWIPVVAVIAVVLGSVWATVNVFLEVWEK